MKLLFNVHDILTTIDTWGCHARWSRLYQVVDRVVLEVLLFTWLTLSDNHTFIYNEINIPILEYRTRKINNIYIFIYNIHEFTTALIQTPNVPVNYTTDQGNALQRTNRYFSLVVSCFETMSCGLWNFCGAFSA